MRGKETHKLKHEEQIQHQTSEASREQDMFYKQSFICILKLIGKIAIIFS
jgi:hypothetical protein